MKKYLNLILFLYFLYNYFIKKNKGNDYKKVIHKQFF